MLEYNTFVSEHVFFSVYCCYKFLLYENNIVKLINSYPEKILGIDYSFFFNVYEI